MSRAARGYALLAILAVAAVLGVALLHHDSPSSETTSASNGVRLDPLPPYVKPGVPDGYAPSRARGLWRLQRIETDGRTLVVRAASGGCWYFDYMAMDSTSPGAIHLTAWNEAWRPTRPNYACTAELGISAYRVRLPEPLLGRRLDGQCEPGDSSPVERQCESLRNAAAFFKDG